MWKQTFKKFILFGKRSQNCLLSLSMWQGTWVIECQSRLFKSHWVVNLETTRRYDSNSGSSWHLPIIDSSLMGQINQKESASLVFSQSHSWHEWHRCPKIWWEWINNHLYIVNEECSFPQIPHIPCIFYGSKFWQATMGCPFGWYSWRCSRAWTFLITLKLIERYQRQHQMDKKLDMDQKNPLISLPSIREILWIKSQVLKTDVYGEIFCCWIRRGNIWELNFFRTFGNITQAIRLSELPVIISLIQWQL
jgi:hypothetical protein